MLQYSPFHQPQEHEGVSWYGVLKNIFAFHQPACGGASFDQFISTSQCYPAPTVRRGRLQVVYASRLAIIVGFASIAAMIFCVCVPFPRLFNSALFQAVESPIPVFGYFPSDSSHELRRHVPDHQS